MDKVQRALAFAYNAHRYMEDDAGLPFILHPLKVMEIMRTVSTDENLICAAVLHDTIEDTDTTQQDLIDNFGEEVADLVWAVTKTGKNCFPRLRFPDGYTSLGHKAFILKFADRTHNLSRNILGDDWDEKKSLNYRVFDFLAS